MSVNASVNGEDKLAEINAILDRGQKDPCWFIETILGVDTLTWKWHRDILNAFVEHDRVAVKSCHSAGKDFISGVLALWFLLCYRPSVVITTAPSLRQVQNIVWGEIRKYYNKCKMPIGGKLKQMELRISDDWYAIGFTTKETHNTIGKFQGFKSENILIIATEAQAMEANIFEQMEGIMTSENSKLYVAGNPLGTDNYFYQIFRDNSYKHFSLSAYESPNYIAGKTVIPGLVGRKWVEDKEKRWGKNSPLFQGRVMGQFPDTGANSMTSLTKLEKCMGTMPKPGTVVASIDVARFGVDNTVFCVANGNELVSLKEFNGHAVTENYDYAVELIKNHKPKYIVIDEGAMGSGLIDMLERDIHTLNKQFDSNTEILTYRFNGRATDRNYYDRGTQDYFEFCDKVDKGQIRLLENYDMFNQFASRKYVYLKGKMKLEPKDDMKKRGLPSPDIADAVVMAFCVSNEETMSEAYEQEQEIIEQEIETSMCPITGYRQIYN